MSDENNPLKDINIDDTNLYKEEMVSDLKMGTIQILTPVKPDGERDPDREVIYSCQTTLMTQMGSIPLNAKVEVDNLADAVAQFPEAIQGAIDKLMAEAERYARSKGFRFMRTETVDFQAKPFYEKLGYEVFGQLADFPAGHTTYCLVKRL